MATVKQTFTGDKNQLEQAYKDLAQQVVRLEQANVRLAQQTEAANRNALAGQQRSNEAIGQGIQNVAQLAAQYAGFAGILAGVNQELRETARLQEKSADTQVAVADAQAAVIKNLTGVSSEQRKRFLEQVADVAVATRFQDLGALNLAAAAGVSASAGDQQVTLDAIAKASRLSRDRPHELPILSGAAIDISKSTGRARADENLGFLMSAGTQARIEELKKQAENIAPAVISGVATVRGDRQQAAIDVAAFFAAASNLAGDKQGDPTRTFTTSFTAQLRDFFEKGQEVTIAGRKLRIKPGEDPGDFAGRLGVLQQDPRLQQRFLEASNFEWRYKVFAEQVLSGGSEADKLFRQGRGAIRFDSAQYEQTAKDLEALTPELSLASARRDAAFNQQQRELALDQEGIAGETRRILREALTSTAGYAESFPGTRYVASELAVYGQDLNYAMGGDPVESAIEQLEARREQVRYRNRSLLARTRQGAATAVEQLSERERADFNRLSEDIAALRRLAERQTQLAEEAGGRDRETRPSAGPAANAELGGQRER
jgi:hypothetical protein